jgi:hypothetical protein
LDKNRESWPVCLGWKEGLYYIVMHNAYSVLNSTHTHLIIKFLFIVIFISWLQLFSFLLFYTGYNATSFNTFLFQNMNRKWFISSLAVKQRKNKYLNFIWFSSWNMDCYERHDFWPRLLLFFSPFLFPSKKEGRIKNVLAKIVIKSQAFQTGLEYDKLLVINTYSWKVHMVR